MKHFGKILSSCFLTGAAAHAASVPNQVIVKFKPTQSIQSVSARESLLESVNFLDQRNLGALSATSLLRSNLAVVRFASGLSPIEASRELRLDPNVEWAQPNYIMTLFTDPPAEQVEMPSVLGDLFAPKPWPNPIRRRVVPKDPPVVAAPALPSPPQADPQVAQAWGLAKIGATSVWAQHPGSREIVVADIDTGVDYTHEDLVNNMWRNPNPNAADKVGYDFANKDNTPWDDQGHGTHTSGTIGATGGNGKGISGVAQAVSIMAVKFITSGGSGTTSDAVLSIDYAIRNKARVMSNSWGGPADDREENKVLEDAVERANQADILFVAAAGNDGKDNDKKPVYPAAIRKPNVLTVASTTDKDGRSFFSNYGVQSVHVGAPGSNVYSTMPGNKYAKNSGTSMACPHVAGLAALILSERPELTAVQVKELIMSSVDRIPALQGKVVTGGRVNARVALQRARSL